MSLLDGSSLIKIKLYYKNTDVGNGKRLDILSDKKAEELLKDEEKAKEIEVLETEWSMLTWKEQNEVMEVSTQAGQIQDAEKKFNFLAYRDAIIKRCLKKWNITINEKIVPVTSESIDKLPAPIVVNLYQKFEETLEFSEEELGN